MSEKIMKNVTKQQPIYLVDSSDLHLHISQGNSKVGKGIWTFSTLPGNADHLLVLKDGRLLTDIAGTCSKHCEGCFNGGCYAVNSARLHHNAVIQAWGQNTLMLRSGAVWKAIDEFIDQKNKKYKETGKLDDRRVKIWRINVSGELESCADVKNWNERAKLHPEVIFSVYTKNYEAIDQFLDNNAENVNKIAPNFIINISQWHHCADAFLAKYPKNTFNIFEYDDSNRKSNQLPQGDIDRLLDMHHCPAVTKEGKHAKTKNGDPITCDMCQRCYRKTGEQTAVYAH